jgi:pilus assembly protein FimV
MALTRTPVGNGSRHTTPTKGLAMFRYLFDRLRAGALKTAAAAAAVLLMVAASPSWALGLGDISLRSSLNEPLDASIEIYDVQGLQAAEIMVSLADAQDFQRVGVERFFFLTDLRFEVVFGAGGTRSIRVRSGQPITEPYVNFLVEVLWPSGRMLKEYTLLLDPPTFSPTPAPAVAAPAATEPGESDAGRVQRPADPVVSTGTHVAMPSTRPPAQPSPLDQGVVGGEYRMTDRNDTLWGIALRTRPSSAVSINQHMLALQRLNPRAFLHGNINLLMAGYSLRLPSEAEALSISDAQATELVAVQNDDWLALRRGTAAGRETARPVAAAEDRAAAGLPSLVDATPARAPAPAASAESGGELRIVATPGDGVAGGGVDAAAEERLAITLEEQDRLAREVEELNSVLARERELASNQLAVKDRQLEVRDQQLAQMQAELERLRAQLAVTAQNQNQNTSSSPQAWWQSPYVLGGAGSLLVLLLVFGLIGARRGRSLPAAAHAEPRLATATASSAFTRSAAGGDHPDAAFDDVPTVTATAGELPNRDDPDTGAETGDAVGEADIYIAYGRYPQAITLLSGVLADEPYRNDVRLKLLELYAETRDRNAFERHLTELQDRCRDEETLLTARELGAQFGIAQEPADTVLEVDADLPVSEDLAVDDESTLEDSTQEETGKFHIDLGSDDDELELVELDDVESPGASAANGSAAHDVPGFELELDEPESEILVSGHSARTPAHVPAGESGIEFGRPGGAVEQVAVDHSAREMAMDLDLDLEAELDVTAVDEDDFGFDDEGDTTSTKLDLARAYIDMGDHDGARDILNEVVIEGNAEQQRRAEAMLEEL